MNFPEDEITELKSLYPDVQVCEEGGVTFFLLPNVPLPDNCEPQNTDALLCPTPRDGYTSRLFFANQIECPKSLNWNAKQVRILERNWYAVSWKIEQPNLRLAQKIAIHLNAFK